MFITIHGEESCCLDLLSLELFILNLAMYHVICLSATFFQLIMFFISSCYPLCTSCWEWEKRLAMRCAVGRSCTAFQHSPQIIHTGENPEKRASSCLYFNQSWLLNNGGIRHSQQMLRRSSFVLIFPCASKYL